MGELVGGNDVDRRSDSSGIISKALVENDTIPHPITRTCRAIDAASVLSILTFT